MAVPTDAVLAVLKQLSHDIRDLDVGTAVDRHQKLAVVQFLRDYVAANKPVVLTGVVKHWPAFTAWTDEYLCSLAGDTEVHVALTPNGRADAVTPLPSSGAIGGGSAHGSGTAGAAGSEGAEAGAGQAAAGDGGAAPERQPRQPAECFALPHQVKMPLKDFLTLLRTSRQKPLGGSGDSAAELSAAAAAGRAGGGAAGGTVVPYLQYQNSSLTAEVPQLLGDVDLLLSWATQAFGGLPEAVNLWIGDERSVTSWHHDPFENIYAVVAGSKTFTLLPPAEVYRMRLRQYSQATYRPVQAGKAGGGDGGGGAASSAGAEAEEDPNPGATIEALLSGAAALRPVPDGGGDCVLWSSIQPGGDPPSAAGAGAPDLFSDPALPPPLRVTVKAGEAIYLPAMWWHQVEQEPDATGRAIAVNYWYDMKWDARQAYLQAVERLAQLIGLNEEPPPAAAARAEEGQLRPPYHTRAFG